MAWKIVVLSFESFKCSLCGRMSTEGDSHIVRHGSSYCMRYCLDCGIQRLGWEEDICKNLRLEALELKATGQIIRPKNEDEKEDNMKEENYQNVCLEFIRPDGSSSIFTGRLLRRAENVIEIDRAAWIADTGRRHLFMAGRPDSTVEIEPYPDDMRISFPDGHVIVMDWPHALPRDPR